MARTFVYKNADKILQEKKLYQQVMDIVSGVPEVDHKLLQESFSSTGWETEKKIVEETSWAWDACKDRVVVSIEFSLIDAIHRDFLRILLWKKMNNVDAMVLITTTFKEPKFENVKRDINIFKSILDVPILLIGLE